MELKGRKILLTGGGGFIGSHLCERLVTDNEVVVYDSGVRDALRFTSLPEHPRFRLVRGDILDRAALRAAAEGAEVILHLAAIAGVSNYYSRPVDTLQTNALGTNVVLEVAREVKPRLFVNFSTSEVYGPVAVGVAESDPTSQGEVLVSRWTYSVSKLAAEHLCFAFHRQHGLPVLSIRPFNVYGARQVGEGAVQIFAPLALRGEPLTIHNDGSQLRAWCHIDDFVDGVMACLDRAPETVGEVWNLGNPMQTVSVAGLAEKIVALCGSRSEIRYAPYRPEGDVRVRFPNIEKAEARLGFRPRVTLDDGLARTIAWYRDVFLHG